MKKVYSAPELSVVAVETASVIAGSVGADLGHGTKNNEGGVSAGLAKDREFEEDNEAFNVTGGEGMATYGDIW